MAVIYEGLVRELELAVSKPPYSGVAVMAKSLSAQDGRCPMYSIVGTKPAARGLRHIWRMWRFRRLALRGCGLHL